MVPLTHLGGSHYSLDWSLEGGTGDLFRFWSTHGQATVIYPPCFEAGGRLVVSGANITGMAGGAYSVLTSTNPAAPLAGWTMATNGTFGAGGRFTSRIPLNASDARCFFTIKTP